MEYVHRCVVCDWHRPAASPTVTSPRCENCGCALESVHAADVLVLDGPLRGIEVPEAPAPRARARRRHRGCRCSSSWPPPGPATRRAGPAIAVAAVGVAGLLVVMAMAAESA